jgi:GrpB-like predicted nucleotidyltransferase (UPF0157 family)
MTTRKPRTEDDLRAITVGELAQLTGPIPFVEYDARWPGLYAGEERRIRAVLGDRVVRIEHTGSTSVPGLAAKPIIDITMTVADVTDERAYAADLDAAGYVLRVRESEPEWWDHRMFRGSDPKVNLHVFSDACSEIDRMVGFRDWLRTHDDDRRLYEQTKRDLIGRQWQNVQQYADAKTDVVEAIAARAGLTPGHP